MAVRSKPVLVLGEILHRLAVVAGAVLLTLAFFLVLPLIQAINKPPSSDMLLTTMEVTQLEPPPPPPEEEPEEEEEPEPEEPPELMEEAPPLDLSQLEVALNPGGAGGWLGGDFTVNLNTAASGSKDVDELFSIADLDQKPRVVYQPGPRITSEVRRRAPGRVSIIFIVDEQGRVTNPVIKTSTDPIFERPALDAIKQWKFEPGKRGGKPVRFRMSVPITFPEGL